MTTSVFYSNSLLDAWRAKAISIVSGGASAANAPTVAEHNAMVAALAMAKDAVTDPARFVFLRSRDKSVYGETDPIRRFGSLLGIFSYAPTAPGALMVQIQQKNMGEAVAAMLFSLRGRLTFNDGGSKYVPQPTDTIYRVASEYDAATYPNIAGTVQPFPSLYNDIVSVLDAAVSMQTRIMPIVDGGTISAVPTEYEDKYSDVVLSLAQQYEAEYSNGQKWAKYSAIAAGVSVGYLAISSLVRAIRR